MYLGLYFLKLEDINIILSQAILFIRKIQFLKKYLGSVRVRERKTLSNT